jgi:protein-disulfide isomerase
VSQGSGAANLVAALIVGGSVVAGALVVRDALETSTTEIVALREAIGERRAPPPERSARPDPGRRYSVDTKGAPVKGNPDAKLAIVEFSDFECPFCRRAEPTLDQIEATYGDRVRIVFKHLPIPGHRRAPDAHAAAEAAHRQGRFWEMHDRIFADPQAMNPETYLGYAREIGLDLEQFRRDLEDPALKQRIAADSAEAAKLGVTGTPSFFVNGRFIAGAQPFEVFQSLIDEELGEKG